MTDIKPLQTGQTVSLAVQESGCYQITILSPGQPGPLVVEIGSDYIVCDDAAEGVTTRIPVHIIKSLTAPAETGTSPVTAPAETEISSVTTPAETEISPVTTPAETSTSPVTAPAETGQMAA